jgi:hypothetical protein
VNHEQTPPPDEEPRKRLIATLPRGTITRTLILLALLFGVIVLQRRAGAIASCMSQTFMLPQSGTASMPADASPPGTGRIRARVVVPEGTAK